jgi:diadenosine tetraphosphate (Ap4A) HIT family hydrolase
MDRTDCDFCNELRGDLSCAFHRIYAGDPDTRVLFRSEKFAVIPSLGHILGGYLLVLPIRHFRAAGDLTGNYLDEFAAICERVGRTLKDQYGPCILFEHGTRSEGVGGCGIYHAHMHAVPLSEVPDPVEILKLRFPYADLTDLSSYLFYRDSDARFYLFDTGPLPSQYMRKLLADALGNQDWDWRKAGREERLLATMRVLSGQFDSAQDFADAPKL